MDAILKNHLTNKKCNEAADILSHAFMEHEFSKYIEPDITKRFKILKFIFEGTCKSINWFGCIQSNGNPPKGIFTWFPPHTYPLSNWQFIKSGSWKSPFKLSLKTINKTLTAFSFADKVKLDMLKDRPFWYLPYGGVLPEYQGKGIGTALINQMHSHLDKNGEASTLEANSEKSVQFWSQYGYKVKVEAEVPGGGLYYYIMVRNF